MDRTTATATAFEFPFRTSELIGPLTATFKTPISCNSLTIDSTGTNPDNYQPILYSPELNDQQLFGLWAGTSCFPDGILTTRGYHSPGICPSGWKSQVFTNGPEKTHNCCPNFATLSTTDPQLMFPVLVRCIGVVDIATSQWVANASNGTIFGWQSTACANRTSGIKITGSGVQVRFKDSDFVTSASDSGSSSTITETSLGASLTTTTTSTLSNTSVSSPADSAQPSSGLPSATKIGIGVGITGAFILISVLAFFLLRRYRKRAKAPSLEQPNPEVVQENGKAELPGNDDGNAAFSSGLAPFEKPELEAEALARQDSPLVLPESNEGINEHVIAELGPGTVQSDVAELAEKDINISHPVELDTQAPKSPTEIARKQPPLFTKKPKQPDLPPATSSESHNQGPLPAVSELYPDVTTTRDDEDLAYDERRLQERRDLIAEKEKLARDEDSLKERRARKAGGAS